MSVCVYIYIYVCMYVHTYVRMYVCMFVCMYVDNSKWTWWPSGHTAAATEVKVPAICPAYLILIERPNQAFGVFKSEFKLWNCTAKVSASLLFGKLCKREAPALIYKQSDAVMPRWPPPLWPRWLTDGAYIQPYLHMQSCSDYSGKEILFDRVYGLHSRTEKESVCISAECR